MRTRNYLVHTVATWETGSRMTGLALPTSDFDRLTVVVLPDDFYMGMNVEGHKDVQQNIVAKDGVTSDVTSMEWRKFLNMLAAGNPSVYPLLWARYDDNSTSPLEALWTERSLNTFSSRRVVKSFLGAAQSSVKKGDGKGVAQALLYVRWLDEWARYGSLYVDRSRLDADFLRRVRTGDETSLGLGLEAFNREHRMVSEYVDRLSWPATPKWDRVSELAMFGVEWAQRRVN